MPVTLKEREAELREAIYRSQHESGLRSLRELAGLKRAEALANWRSATGDSLVKFQTRYNAMQEIIDFIEKAPMRFSSAKV